MLEEREIEVVAQQDARKERIEADAAWQLLATAEKITVAKGRGKTAVWHPETDDKEAILKDVMGRSGNLRAPTLQVGNEFFVGFNEAVYAEQFGE